MVAKSVQNPSSGTKDIWNTNTGFRKCLTFKEISPCQRVFLLELVKEWRHSLDDNPNSQKVAIPCKVKIKTE